jgi:hypothetical protein
LIRVIGKYFPLKLEFFAVFLQHVSEGCVFVLKQRVQLPLNLTYSAFSLVAPF